MADTPEIRWEYDVVEVGQTGPILTIEVTEQLIAQYATGVRNPNPEYHPAGPGDLERQIKLAMPTMIFRVAPLRRPDIAANNGFTALEKASEDARQTPFSKCEVRWHAPIHAGDFITSFGHILSKEERRGNKFVTFRVEATNQNDEKVAEYDYTCVFEYAKGQNVRD
jgi:hypothetical protein